jgi:hypothetical protein
MTLSATQKRNCVFPAPKAPKGNRVGIFTPSILQECVLDHLPQCGMFF